VSGDVEAPTRPSTDREGLPDPRAVSEPPSLIPRVPAPDPDEALDALAFPPLTRGLPNTSYSSCASLICAIVWQAIYDRDMHWCAGPRFNFYLSLLGWDNALIYRAKQLILARHAKAQPQTGAPLSALFRNDD
jgi:hypothetical protein